MTDEFEGEVKRVKPQPKSNKAEDKRPKPKTPDPDDPQDERSALKTAKGTPIIERQNG